MNGMGIYGILANQFALFGMLQLAIVDGIPNSFNEYRQRYLERYFYEYLWKYNTFLLYQIKYRPFIYLILSVPFFFFISAALVPVTLILSSVFYFISTILMNETFISNYQHQLDRKSQQQQQQYIISTPSKAPERIII
ncbi:hypothetical protein SNEBB_008007 [Seison nebaliae]|nr:hypothetical protein SNEBB_008007 [Seison nebaliae]